MQASIVNVLHAMALHEKLRNVKLPVALREPIGRLVNFKHRKGNAYTFYTHLAHVISISEYMQTVMLILVTFSEGTI